MRNILSTGIWLFFMSSLVFAQVNSDVILLNGIIVDCDTMNNYKDTIDSFLATYTKEDALKPDAIESGYSIYLKDGFMKFDSASNAKIVEFLKKASSTLAVSIQVIIGENDILSLVSIENE